MFTYMIGVLIFDFFCNISAHLTEGINIKYFILTEKLCRLLSGLTSEQCKFRSKAEPHVRTLRNRKIRTMGVDVVAIADKSISNTNRSRDGREHLGALNSQQTAAAAAAVAMTSFVT